MNVLADCHHGGLFYSLQLLFQKRLGWDLYRPIGMDWFTSGYWKIAEPYGNNEDTVKQFLDINNLPWSPDGNLNGGNYEKDGIYYIYDPRFKQHQKAITFEKFKEMDFDFVISSIPAHDICYEEMVKIYKPKAKHIAQMGNIYQTTTVKNVMCSTNPYPVPSDKNVVFYHQEFDVNVFKYTEPTEFTKINSFVNCLPNSGMYELYKSNLSEFEFKSYGIGCPDGIISGESIIADLMSKSVFGYHIKPGGDGFGHILHNWYACGRPVITNISDYADKLAGNLLIDGKTCINLESCNFNENINRIRYWSLPEHHKEMCENAYNRFKEVCNFDEEFEKIKIFLSNVI